MSELWYRRVRGHAERGRPILLLGVSRRSGTNYLASLLLCHRDTAAPAAPVAEDHLLSGITSLERYVGRTARRWPRRWGDRDSAAADLRRALGEGLLRFLDDRSDGIRTVSRTPSTANLGRAARWYAGADVVLLVRDGRSVAASLATAWGWPLELAILEWRRGARRILGLRGRPGVRVADAARADAVDEPSAGARFLLVRYEDVLADLDTAVDRLLRFTGLDPAGFDHDRARNLPVLGSSYARDDDGRLTWEPRSATPGFDPTRRFAEWTGAERARFAWLAGDEQRALGYPDETGPGRPARARMIALDATLPIRLAPWRARRSVANALRSARGEWRARRARQVAGDEGAPTSSSTSASTASSSASTR
jgi:hypothetical protein